MKKNLNKTGGRDFCFPAFLMIMCSIFLVINDLTAQLVDLGIFNPECGEFEVRVKPETDLLNTSVTNLQFTLQWPENSVSLGNFSSSFDLQQQGPVFVQDGNQYMILATATPVPVNWTAGTEYVVLEFEHDQSGTGYANFSIANDSWTTQNNGTYYLEVLGLDKTGSLYNPSENAFLETCGVIDVGLFNTACSAFEVRVLPHDNYLNTTLTNVQFTIRWAENTVGLINFNTAYVLVQQGNTITANGYNYAVFATATPIAINWTLESEVVLLEFSHDQSGTGYADFLIGEDSWTQGNNASYFIEILGLDKTGEIYQQATNTYLGTCGVIDVGIFSPECGQFEVRALPHDPYADVSLTNVQFTVRWPSGTVDLLNYASAYGIEAQGGAVENNGFNYQVFAGATPTILNWTADEEVVLLTFERTSGNFGTLDFEIAEDTWTIDNNAQYYFEILGLDYTGIIYANAPGTYSGPCDYVEIKVFLQGPYNGSSGTMNTTLNTSGTLPLSHPYDVAPWNYPGTESLTAIPSGMVDWVLVEARSGTSENTTVERKAGCLMEDGNIVDPTDITRGLEFENIIAGNDYYLVVWHRNHIPVMSGDPATLPTAGETYDFTEIVNTQPYLHNDPLPVVLELGTSGSGVFGMIAGDINADGNLRYLGSSDDRSKILSKVTSVSGLPYLNTAIYGFYNEDINMNNQVLYLGPNDDRALILSNLFKLTGATFINVSYSTVVPGATN